MNPNQTIAEHIKYLHKKVAALKVKRLSDEEIVAVLKKEDGIDTLYAYTLIENTAEDKRDAESFWKLIATGIICFAAAIFILCVPQFDGYRQGLIYWFLVWTPLVGGIFFFTRAFILFKK